MLSPNPRLLAEEEFVSVQPSLIRALDGKVIDALVLQYLYWWWRISTNEHDGYTWVYNSETTWADRLGLSRDQVRRTITRLEERGLVISCKPNSSGWDHTKWYRIDLDHPLWADCAESHIRMSDTAQSRMCEIAHSSSSTERTTERTSQEDSPPPCPQKPMGDQVQNTSSTSSPNPQAPPLSHPSPITTPEGVAPTRDSTPPADSTGRPSKDDTPDPEVVRLCHLLADLYHANGNTRPNPDQKAWYRECRLLLTKDGPDGTGWPVEKVENVMRWGLAHQFWKTNLRSMPKFRYQFDTVRGQALEEHRKNKQPSRGAPTLGEKIAAYKAAKESS